MSIIENSFSRDPYPSLYHRLTNKYCLMVDIDNMLMEEGHMENVNIDYCFNYGKRKRVAMFDYKRMNVSTISKQKVGTFFIDYYGNKKNIDPMLAQIDLADALNLPFFIVCTYLDPQWDNKQYLTIPVNENAKSFFVKYNQDTNGTFMSLKSYAQFHSTLRGKPFDQEEEINLKARWNEYIKLSDKPIYKMKELPNTIKQYPKPIIYLEEKYDT